MLEQLAKHRQRQASAMERFALAQERIAQIEAHLQSLREPAQSPPPTQQTISPQLELNEYLPTSGDLELQPHFSPTQLDMSLEPTEQLTPLRGKTGHSLPSTTPASDETSQDHL